MCKRAPIVQQCAEEPLSRAGRVQNIQHMRLRLRYLRKARLAGGYGCPFAHLLSACTCYILKNFNDKTVAAYLKLDPRMSISRPRESFSLRNYDISGQFCVARLSLTAALLISNILRIFFEIPPHISLMSACARLSSKLWRKWPSGTYRHLLFT